MRFPEAADYLLAYHGRRRRKVRSAPFPPDGENSTRSLAPPLPIGPASLGSDGSPDSPDRDKPVPPKPPPPREKPPFVLPPANPDQRRVFAYLRKRGITAQVIQRFIDTGLEGNPRLRCSSLTDCLRRLSQLVLSTHASHQPWP